MYVQGQDRKTMQKLNRCLTVCIFISLQPFVFFYS